MWTNGLLTLVVWGVHTAKEIGSDKTALLVSRALSSPTGVITLEESEIANLLWSKPRPYDLVLFVTTSSCRICASAQSAFEEAAALHRVRQTFRPRRHRSDERVRRPLFFGVVTLSSQSQAFIMRYGLTNVPNLIYTTPAEVSHPNDSLPNDEGLKPVWKISGREIHTTTHKMLEWINKRSGDNVRIARSQFSTLRLLLILLPLSALAVGSYFYFPNFFLNERLWLLAGLGLYVFGAGGFVSVITTGAGFVAQSGDQIVLIKRGIRGQTGAEGLIVMGLMLGSAFGLVAAAQLMRRPTGGVRVALLSATSLLFAFWAVLKLEEIFRSKNFYNPIFFPPGYFIRGPLVKDYGLIA